MTNKLHILGFDIDTEQIPINDIEEKSKTLSKKRINFFLKRFNSENEFLILLFHLIFVERLEKSDIARIIGYKNAANVHHLLYDLGWSHFSSDENDNILQEARDISVTLDCDASEHTKLKSAINKVANVNEKAYQKLGFQSGEEYAHVLYYLAHVMELSPTKICGILNLTWSMTQHHLSDLGLNKDYTMGMDGKVKQKTQDYGETGRSRQRTRRKTQYKYFAPTSSGNEEYFRRQLSDFIYSHIDPKRYEIIVGVNNTGIINPFEVDIPVIIYQPEKNFLIRFAIEYKDPSVHDTQKDEARKISLTEKGWNYFEVIDIPEYSNNRASLDRKIHGTCEYIKAIIETRLDPVSS